jgi:hypothetical protein
MDDDSGSNERSLVGKLLKLIIINKIMQLYLSVIRLETKLRMRANREREMKVTSKLTNKIQNLRRQEEDNYNQDILPTIDTQSNPKFKKMQKRKMDDNFYQIQKYDNMLDDKLVELRDLLKKEK